MTETQVIVGYLIGFLIAFLAITIQGAREKGELVVEELLGCIVGGIMWPFIVIILPFVGIHKLYKKYETKTVWMSKKKKLEKTLYEQVLKGK